MRQTSRVPLLVLVIGAVLVFSVPIRQATLTLVRFPFQVTKAAVLALLALPRFPGLAQENAALRAEAIQRDLELAQLREAVRGLGRAQELLEATGTRQGLVAAVIGRSVLPTQHTVLLDRGVRQGLTLESVIVDASGLVGRVTEVQGASALVMLLTDPDSRVAGLIERSRETGLLIGRGRGQCEFIYLDVDAKIEPGDRILTAGLGGPFPKGLVLGTVTRVVRDERLGTASAWVEPAARLSRLEEVLCLPPEEPSGAGGGGRGTR